METGREDDLLVVSEAGITRKLRLRAIQKKGGPSSRRTQE